MVDKLLMISEILYNNIDSCVGIFCINNRQARGYFDEIVRNTRDTDIRTIRRNSRASYFMSLDNGSAITVFAGADISWIGRRFDKVFVAPELQDKIDVIIMKTHIDANDVFVLSDAIEDTQFRCLEYGDGVLYNVVNGDYIKVASVVRCITDTVDVEGARDDNFRVSFDEVMGFTKTEVQV